MNKEQLIVWLQNQYPGVDINLEDVLKHRSEKRVKDAVRAKIKETDKAFLPYRGLYRAVQKVALGFAHLAFIQGKPGIGKSKHIEQCLSQLGVKYFLVAGDVTEAYLYRILWEENGNVIWFRDVSKLLKGLRSLNLLKNATEIGMNRLVSKKSYSFHDADLPEEFEFTGKIIFDYNIVPKTKGAEDFEALKSRGLNIELELTPSEIVSVMRAIAKTPAQKEVTEYLIQNYHFNGLNPLNLRTQQKAFQTYEYCKTYNLGWKQQLKDDLKLSISPVKRRLLRLIGEEGIRVSELKRRLVLSGEISSLRTAHRRIGEWIEMGELHKASHEQRNFLVKV